MEDDIAFKFIKADIDGIRLEIIDLAQSVKIIYNVYLLLP